MRAFTATFEKIKIEIKVQMFMLEGTNQPLIAGGWEGIFPHGQVLHGLLPKDFSQGLRDPLSNRIQLLLLLSLSRYLNPPSLIPKPIPQPILSLLNLQGKGGQPHPLAQQPLPMLPGPKLLTSSFFFTSH